MVKGCLLGVLLYACPGALFKHVCLSTDIFLEYSGSGASTQLADCVTQEEGH